MEHKHIPKTDRKMPVMALLPNLLTIGAICAGLTAVRFAFQGNFELSVQLILLACVMDGLDGRIARMTNSESPLGAELDSLADFANFGVAPALMLYAWALQDMRSAGWIAVLIYAVCCVLRLARFNVDNKSDEEQSSDFFVGVPAPAGAMLVLLPIFLSFLDFGTLQTKGSLVGLYMVFIGLLMVSRIPTYSFKNTMVYRKYIKFLLIAFAIFAALLLTYPWYTLAMLDLVYLSVILRSILTYKNRITEV